MFKIGDKVRIINMKGEDHYNGREGWNHPIHKWT